MTECSGLWSSPLTWSERLRCIAIAKSTADHIARSCLLENNHSILNDSAFALLFGYLEQCCPDKKNRYRKLIDLCIRHAVREASEAGHGLIGGLAQLGIVVEFLSQYYAGYNDLLSELDSSLAKQAPVIADELNRQIDERELQISQYDLVSGVSGTAAYLLRRTKSNAQLKQAAEALLNRLVYLAIPQGEIPKFAVAKRNVANYLSLEECGDYVVNCGLAHGIPGVLAVLSLAYSEGFVTEELKSAISRLTDWLIAIVDSASNCLWPRAVAIGRSPGSLQSSALPIAWCYGGLGVSRAIWLAASALQNPDYAQFSSTAFKMTSAAFFEQHEQSPWPGLCHGTAGLLLMNTRFFNETTDSQFEKNSRKSVVRLLKSYDPRNRFGFKNLHSDSTAEDDPSFMTGACGVALALLAASCQIKPTWDRILALS